MTLVFLHGLYNNNIFKDMTDLDIRKQIYQDQMDSLEQDMLPFGIIDDGKDETTVVDNTGQVWEIADPEHQRSYF